tara:strand:+ start:271 stop:504 length:234 start_codon:yes stop_codon:yes gene_type:complete
MTPKKPFNKVEGLLFARKEIEKEIEELQSICHHPIKSIKNVRERLDSTLMVIRYVCDECSSVIGIPNHDDLQNYLKQ